MMPGHAIVIPDLGPPARWYDRRLRTELDIEEEARS